MTNRGAWSTTINPGGSVTIPAGYHNGGGSVSAGSASISVPFYKQISETSAGRYASVTLPNAYDVVIVNVNYPDTYSDNGVLYSEKSSFYEFRYYSQLCQFYIYKNVGANSTFTNKCIPGNNAGISVLAFNVE